MLLQLTLTQTDFKGPTILSVTGGLLVLLWKKTLSRDLILADFHYWWVRCCGNQLYLILFNSKFDPSNRQKVGRRNWRKNRARRRGRRRRRRSYSSFAPLTPPNNIYVSVVIEQGSKIGKPANQQTGKQKGCLTDPQAGCQTGKPTDGMSDRQTSCSLTNQQTNTTTNRLTNRQTDQWLNCISVCWLTDRRLLNCTTKLFLPSLAL